MSPRFTTPAAVAAMLVAMMAAPARAADYVQAPGSSLAFATKYDGEVFSGRFGGFDTKLRFDPAQLDDARLEVTIRLAGTSTGNGDRDSTLAGSDFFNVARFAEATYVADRFRAVDDGYVADGTLTLRGVSRPVALHFTWTPGQPALLSGRATVRRLEFGVGGGDWADTGMIPDEVAISTRVFLHSAP